MSRPKPGQLKRRVRAETQNIKFPERAVKADHSELAHNNTYGRLPEFYIDSPFICIDCGSQEVWTAKQQKWWYETAKGNINSKAVRCRMCRNKIKEEKVKQKKHMEDMAQRTPHPNEAFFKNT
ncbi:MAG: zinc-ribbon domain containing protein [Prochlorothrix sp.]|nr:zinc-ribbon domain containing protein [Prochlorothrix sp.]